MHEQQPRQIQMSDSYSNGVLSIQQIFNVNFVEFSKSIDLQNKSSSNNQLYEEIKRNEEGNNKKDFVFWINLTYLYKSLLQDLDEFRRQGIVQDLVEQDFIILNLILNLNMLIFLQRNNQESAQKNDRMVKKFFNQQKIQCQSRLDSIQDIQRTENQLMIPQKYFQTFIQVRNKFLKAKSGTLFKDEYFCSGCLCLNNSTLENFYKMTKSAKNQYKTHLKIFYILFAARPNKRQQYRKICQDLYHRKRKKTFIFLLFQAKGFFKIMKYLQDSQDDQIICDMNFLRHN